MTIKYTWYLGADIPDSQQTVQREEVEQEMADIFEESGCHIDESSGTWKGEVEENFVISHVSDESFSDEEAERIAERLKERFGQESVMVEQDEIQVQFV